MRIFQVTPLFYPALVGVELHVQVVSEGLMRLVHEVGATPTCFEAPCLDAQAAHPRRMWLGSAISVPSALGLYPPTGF